MEIKELFAYAEWSKERLRSAVEANPDVWSREFESIASFTSIRAITAHIAAAEERWMMRILGKPRPDPGFEDRAGASIADVFEGWDGIRSITREFVAKANSDDLAIVHHVTLPHGEVDKRVEQMLFQAFNHQTYHLGQISMSMQRWGVDPPNFDAILLPDIS